MRYLTAFLLLSLSLTLQSCLPLIAAGAGAAGGYYVGKNYNVKVKSPVEVEKKND
jgi:ABC-type microcin C transport system permease subunit YejE